MALTNRKPVSMAMMTRSMPPPVMARSAASARLVQPEMMAHSCSLSLRSSVLERAISRPSDDTATASVTPDVSATKLLSSQLKLRASSVSIGTFSPLVGAAGAGRLLVEATLHAARQARQELLHLRAVDGGLGPAVRGVGHRPVGAGHRRRAHMGAAHPAHQAAGGALGLGRVGHGAPGRPAARRGGAAATARSSPPPASARWWPRPGCRPACGWGAARRRRPTGG